ncbi:MAG: ABC transporter substrate-binding protein [Microbacterium sp.]
MKNITARRGAVAVAVAISATLPLAGCSGDTSAESTADADGLTTVTVQTTQVVSGQGLVMGDEQGYFEDEGLSLEYVDVADTAAAVAAVQSGTLDFGFSPFVSVLQMASQGLDVQIVAPGDGYEIGQVVETDEEAAAIDATAVYASAGSGITSAEDLAGKTIAVPALSSQADATITSVLQDMGVDTSGINWVKLDFTSALSSLESDQIDAAFLVSPYTVQAENAGLVHVLSPGVRFFEEGAVSGWFTSTSFAEENPEIIEAFQEAVAEGAAWANANPTEAVQEVIDRTGLDVTPDELPVPYWPETIRTEDIERMQEKLIAVGLYDDPVDLSTLILPQLDL